MKSPVTGNTIHPPVKELLNSIPEIFGIRANEEPVYKVIAIEGDVEVRRYPAATLASITLQGTFDEYRNEAFKHLAAYIFGENSSHVQVPMTAPVIQREENHIDKYYDTHSEQIAMTAPVLQKQEGSSWTMSFILPEKYNFERPPESIDPAIRFSKVDPRLIAAVKYSGTNDMEKMEANKQILEKWLNRHPQYKAMGPVYWAQYDAPFAIPFLKRNEAMLELSV